MTLRDTGGCAWQAGIRARGPQWRGVAARPSPSHGCEPAVAL